MANYYEVLEVNEKASVEVIDKAYKVLAKKYHPDVYEGDKKEAEKKMKELNEAYDILSDETRRKNYDSSLALKRQVEQAKAAKQHSVQSQNAAKAPRHNPNIEVETDTSGDTPINNPAKFNRDQFVVDTTYMDEKQKRKIKKKLQERYVEAYDNYLRERGYKLTYKWTFKRVMQVIGIILLSILVFTILFFIPPIHSYFMELYNENFLIKFVVDIFGSLFTATYETIKELFK